MAGTGNEIKMDIYDEGGKKIEASEVVLKKAKKGLSLKLPKIFFEKIGLKKGKINARPWFIKEPNELGFNAIAVYFYAMENKQLKIGNALVKIKEIGEIQLISRKEMEEIIKKHSKSLVELPESKFDLDKYPLLFEALEFE